MNGPFALSHPLEHKGVVLLLCMLMLFALTLIGLAAASDQVLQIQMSANQVVGSQSSRSADIALEWAEDWLFGLDGAQKPTTCSGACANSDIVREQDTFGDDVSREPLVWWEHHAYPVGTDPQTGIILDEILVRNFPDNYWLIEEVHVEPVSVNESEVSEIAFYRILARATPGQGSLYTVAESIIARPWGDASLHNEFPPAINRGDFCVRNEGSIPCGRLAWRQLH